MGPCASVRQRGDLLTSSSTPGHAMRATPIDIGGMAFYRPGTIIGKALDPLATWPPSVMRPGNTSGSLRTHCSSTTKVTAKLG